MSYSEKTEFEKERDRLIGEIAENLAKCVTNVNQLNRNIENVAVVGSGFDPVHNLWKQFERVMANASQIPVEDPVEPILQPSFPAGTDESAALPVGIAPGGGETVQLAASVTETS